MKRLQIMIDEDLDAELARRASAEGRSKASIIRETLRQTLRPLPPLEEDPLWEMVGAKRISSALAFDADFSAAGFVELRS